MNGSARPRGGSATWPWSNGREDREWKMENGRTFHSSIFHPPSSIIYLRRLRRRRILTARHAVLGGIEHADVRQGDAEDNDDKQQGDQPVNAPGRDLGEDR